jgi:hypothetical protein
MAEADMPISQPPRCDGYDMQEAPRIRHRQLTSTEFHAHWSRGIPVIVTNVVLQGKWGPQYFVREHGETKITLVDCETEQTRNSTVAEFFGSFGQSEGRTKIEKCKASFSALLCLYLLYTLFRIGLRNDT